MDEIKEVFIELQSNFLCRLTEGCRYGNCPCSDGSCPWKDSTKKCQQITPKDWDDHYGYKCLPEAVKKAMEEMDGKTSV